MELESLQLEFHMAKFSTPLVELEFESCDYCHRTRDASLQHYFKIGLTYYIVSHSCASLQITPLYSNI